MISGNNRSRARDFLIRIHADEILGYDKMTRYKPKKDEALHGRRSDCFYFYYFANTSKHKYNINKV